MEIGRVVCVSFDNYFSFATVFGVAILTWFAVAIVFEPVDAGIFV